MHVVHLLSTPRVIESVLNCTVLDLGLSLPLLSMAIMTAIAIALPSAVKLVLHAYLPYLLPGIFSMHNEYGQQEGEVPGSMFYCFRYLPSHFLSPASQLMSVIRLIHHSITVLLFIFHKDRGEWLHHSQLLLVACPVN
jgi:hypothetical protein